MTFARATAAALLLLGACSGGDSGTGPDTANTTAGDGGETGGTITSRDGYTLTPVVSGLTFPWDMVFLPSGEMLVSERDGHIRVVRDGTLQDTPIAGTPNALVEGQGGYFAMALDSDVASNRTLYLAYAKGTTSENTTAVIKGVLSEDASELTDVQEIFAGTMRGSLPVRR